MYNVIVVRHEGTDEESRAPELQWGPLVRPAGLQELCLAPKRSVEEVRAKTGQAVVFDYTRFVYKPQHKRDCALDYLVQLGKAARHAGLPLITLTDNFGAMDDRIADTLGFSSSFVTRDKNEVTQVLAARSNVRQKRATYSVSLGINDASADFCDFWENEIIEHNNDACPSLRPGAVERVGYANIVCAEELLFTTRKVWLDFIPASWWDLGQLTASFERWKVQRNNGNAVPLKFTLTFT
jgi:hypothetical protein